MRERLPFIESLSVQIQSQAELVGILREHFKIHIPIEKESSLVFPVKTW